MYYRSLEIYSRGPYSLYLQGTWNKEHEMWSHNNSTIKDTTGKTDSRPCTRVSVIQRVHCTSMLLSIYTSVFFTFYVHAPFSFFIPLYLIFRCVVLHVGGLCVICQLFVCYLSVICV